MTEPSLLVADVPMDESAFRGFVAGEAGKAFAEAAARIVIDGSDDFLMLRYAKREAALFLAFVFRWADLDTDIVKRPYFKALLGVGASMAPGARGSIMISPGAMNFLIDGIDAVFAATPEGVQRQEAAAPGDVARIDDLLNRYLFRGRGDMGAGAYREAIRDRNVLDTRLRKRVERLLEAHRRTVARERLPEATPVLPVRLFDHFHYNGHFVVYTGLDALRPLPAIDPATLRQRPYGASDARHVIVEGRVLETDPDSFKALGRVEQARFYRDARRVYDAKMRPIEAADPKTFRIVSPAFARDRARWYDWKGTVLPDVGEKASFDDRFYFLNFHLLIGDRSIYMGETRLPVDAGSFEIRKSEYVANELVLLWAADREGDIVVSARALRDKTPRIERTREPEAVWAARRAVTREHSPLGLAYRDLDAATPQTMQGEAACRTFVAFFEGWLGLHSSLFTGARRFDDYLWRGINNYLYCLWTLREPQKMIAYYQTVEEAAWWNPFVFHHTACAYVALGELDRAVGEVRRALAHGYERADDLLADADLAALFDRPDFHALKVWRESAGKLRRTLLPLELVSALASDSIATSSRDVMHAVERRYRLPSDAQISHLYAGREAEAAAYRAAWAKTLNGLAFAQWRAGANFHVFRQFYAGAEDVPGLSPGTHLCGALAQFREGFSRADFNGDRFEPSEEFALADAALRRMRAALAADPARADDPFWRELEASDLAAPFITMA